MRRGHVSAPGKHPGKYPENICWTFGFSWSSLKYNFFKRRESMSKRVLALVLGLVFVSTMVFAGGKQPKPRPLKGNTKSVS
jgi:hypothetical protein